MYAATEVHCADAGSSEPESEELLGVPDDDDDWKHDEGFDA